MGNVSEKDSVYSTDDEVVRPVVKRKKKANTIASSSNSDEDSDIEIRPKIIGKRQSCKSEDDAGGLNEVEINKNSSDALNNQSDSEQVDKCAICLSKFLGQDIATPEACDHVFCLECLQEWAKNVNTCPIDRLKFNLILIRHHKEEKVIKTIVVNNSELPYSSDAETESSAQYQIAFCDFCTEEGLADCFVRCFHCRKFYHYYCLISRSSNSLPWQCPTCENDVSLSSELLMRHRPQLLRSPFRNRRRRGYIQTTDLLIRQRFHCEAALNRSLLSTLESSEEDTTDNSPISSRLYQNPAISSISNSDSPLLKKRRNTICHPRGRALVSSAVSATSGTRALFDEDSGDEYNDLRLSSAPVPENYDLVGSILQSQTLLHAPDVLTLSRDGSLLRNSKQENSPRRFSMNTSPMQNSGESNQSSLPDSSFFSDGTVSPYNGDVVVKQRPLNPTQNNNSKYGETPKQAHSSASSGSSMERSLSYNENSVARLPLGSSNSDHYSNDPCSPIGQKNYCGSSAAEDPKKDRPSKNQHSEDEVDIYSDIESVGEEDGSLSDRVEPMKVSFKCEDSQLSNPNEASDSSDNDLVIDEDMHGEDEDKVKDGQEPYSSSKHKSSQNKNNVPHCESEESNASSNAGSDEEQLTIEETNSENPRPSFIDNSSDNCYNPTEESPARFQNDDSNVSKLSPENETAPKNESDSDANQQESDVDMQEYEENSQDSAKKSFQADTNTPCTSVKSSPKSCRGETSDGFEIQCDNSVSNENSRCGENSGFEQEEFKEVYEEASNQENTCDSVSQGGENENLATENNSNLSEATSQVEGNDNFHNEQNSNLSSGSDQRNADASEPEDFVDSNLTPVRGSSPSKAKSANTSNDVSMKSDEEEDNLDSIENASTPCLDENQDGMLENSPVVEDNYEDTGPDFEASPQNNTEISKEDDDSTANEEITSEKMECDAPSTVKMGDKDSHDNTVDLGIEDISDAGSDDLRDEFTDEVSTSERAKKETRKQKVASPFSPDHSETAEEEKTNDCFQQVSEEVNKSQSNQSFEDHEEGEIIEERPRRCNRRKKERLREEANYTEYNPRVNISDLPRIPKLKRDKDKENVSEVITFENKRTSVLSRVDLGSSADISWKRLSKHTRERSYRDGRPKDERLLYRERESRNKDKNSGESSRRTEKNSEHRREEKKQEVEKSKKDYDSRSRKAEKNKPDEWNYSERDKRKSRKDKHSKDKHSKDKKEKDKHDKTKYSKDESKYEREKTKEDSRYERDSRYDKEERFERIVYEKDKFKEHKSKHKDRKGDSKSSKDHSREKHKHSHSSNDHFSDKQREREVRKVDDKIKIVVEQKDSRKEKSKHKEKKESKHDKKVTPRKVESERIPYTESTSIESKEIFAKGDSIIINVNFNRASSPKNNSTVKGPEPISKDRKVATEELDKEDQVSPEEAKCKPKHSNTEKGKSSHEAVAAKRPTTPPKNPPVLSVSESYWQGGDDPDDNSRSSDKSIVEIRIDDDSDEESPNAFEANNLSNGGSSLDPAPTVLKDTNSNTEEPASAPEKEATSNFPKEPESFPLKRRSPRSPSPPSPADNDSYDPCEPTKSPSPPPMPPPPLPTTNPKPPPSPELPPLPPEPEPMDNDPIKPPEFVSVPAVMVSSSAQPVTVHTQTSMASPLPMQGMMLPPPSFLSQVSSAASMPNMIVPPRSGSFQMSGHPVLLPSNHVPQVMGGSFVPPPMHGNTSLPPPPNPPPNMPHMSSVPPPPPPPAGITLLPQVRHPHLGVHPSMNPTSLLQSLAMGHSVATPLQLVHQLPPNLSGILANQAQMVRNAQNQLASLPVSMANPQGSRMVLSQNQILNHSALFQNQNMNDCNKSQGNSASLLPPHTQIMQGGSGLQLQMSEKLPKTSPPPSADKNEVVDMDVDTPYSPACSPSVDSVGDYSPTCSPIPSSPKSKDIFDSLLPTEQRTSEKRTYDVAGSEKSKQHSSKKSKHEHKSDSKSRHSVRMQVKDKHKKSRKEHKQTDRKESSSKLEDTQLKILDELPSSAVEMQVKEKFLKKLNRQERVVEEVKFVLKPYYKSRDVTKDEYKDILRKSVPKICHNKSGEINPVKVKYLVECYVKKAKHSRKKGEKKKSTLS